MVGLVIGEQPGAVIPAEQLIGPQLGQISGDQGVTLQLTIHGKLVGEVGMQIDSNHVLRIREIRRPDLDDSPIRRGWDLR